MLGRRTVERWFPAPPAELGEMLAAFQFDSVRRQVPILHAIAILNLLIVDFVLWRQGVDPAYYVWTPAIMLFCLWRLVAWRRRNRAARPAPREMRRFLDGASRAAVASVAIVSGFAAATYLAGGFDYPLLIPISLAFGVFSIAHCLAPMRFTSVATLALGTLPCGLAMLATGDFQAQVIGFSMMSVAALKTGFLRDYHAEMTARLALQYEIELLATRDPLTGLLNRRAMHERIEAALARGQGFALAVIDLDGFKTLNDTRGHHAGDLMLRLVARRLQQHAGQDSAVARFGGDEFVVMLPHDGASATADARMTDVLAALATPGSLEGERLVPAASLGYATFPESGQDLDTLFRAADAALYAAKRGGKGVAIGRPAARRAA